MSRVLWPRSHGPLTPGVADVAECRAILAGPRTMRWCEHCLRSWHDTEHCPFPASGAVNAAAPTPKENS